MFATKTYIFLVLLIGSERITISDALKRNYFLEVEAFDVVRDPKFLVRVNYLRVGKYNSTMRVINANVTYLEDLPLDATVRATAFQLMSSNKYSMIPVGLKPFRFCEVIEKDKEFYPALQAKGMVPTECPVRKGTYWVKNLVPDFDGLPPELPGDRWRVDVEMTTKGRLVVKFHVFVFVNRNL